MLSVGPTSHCCGRLFSPFSTSASPLCVFSSPFYTSPTGFVCLPKSAQLDRIKDNADVFDFALSPDTVAELDGFDEHFTSAFITAKYSQLEPY